MLLQPNKLRHDLMQAASVAVLMTEELLRLNQDERLALPLNLLEQALKELAKTIDELDS